MKQKLIIAAALASVFMASPVQAQSLGDFLGSLLEDEDLFKKQPKVEDMGSVCQQSSLAYWFAWYSFGYNQGFTDEADKKENALSEEIVGRAKITNWKFQRWVGNPNNGDCYMQFRIEMSPEDAVHFNNDPVIETEIKIPMTKDNETWKVYLFGVSQSVLNYTRPFTQAILGKRYHDKEKLAQEALQLQKEERARQQQAYWVANPKEYQTYLARQRTEQARANAVAAERSADEARRRRSCEDAGGTWGRRTFGPHSVPIGEVGCFFQTGG